jgi:hypothetical protein
MQIIEAMYIHTYLQYLTELLISDIINIAGTPHPLLVPRSKIEQSYTSTLPMGLCGPWKGETYLLT